MTLNTHNNEFDYHTENSDQFSKDFMNYVVTDIPLFALQDELLYLMNKRRLTSFRVPGYKTIDGNDHIFYFNVEKLSDNSRITIYKYEGMDLKKYD